MCSHHQCKVRCIGVLHNKECPIHTLLCLCHATCQYCGSHDQFFTLKSFKLLRSVVWVLSYLQNTSGTSVFALWQGILASRHRQSCLDSVLRSFLGLCRGWKIAVDIASALVFLHTKGLVHLDIKSLNILLGQGRNEAKLADLGLARLVKEGNLDLQHTLPGTPAYSAPEVMRAQIQWRLRSQGQKELFSTEVWVSSHYKPVRECPALLRRHEELSTAVSTC